MHNTRGAALPLAQSLPRSTWQSLRLMGENAVDCRTPARRGCSACRLAVLTEQSRSSCQLLERKNASPVILHADHVPTVLHRFVVQRLGEGADLGVGQALRRTVGVFAV